MIKTPLHIVPGASGDWRMTITAADGTAQSLAALTDAWVTAKQQLSDADPGLFQLAIGSGITVEDSAAGVLRVLASPAQTALLAGLRKAWWDCRLKFADGTVSNPENLYGEIVIEPRVTTAN